MYLEMEQVSKIIKGDTILDQITLHLDKGKIYGLQGKNGSGKTMILKAACGLIFPTSGHVAIDGEILGEKRDFPKSVGALIENPGFIGNYSAFENLKALADIKHIISDDKIYETLEECGLADTGRKKYRKFSLGMKQKLGIAAAIMEAPELILLDEPTNALDEQSVKNLAGILGKHKERGALIMIASHDKEELHALADEIFVVENGRIVRSYRPGEEG